MEYHQFVIYQFIVILILSLIYISHRIPLPTQKCYDEFLLQSAFESTDYVIRDLRKLACDFPINSKEMVNGRLCKNTESWLINNNNVTAYIETIRFKGYKLYDVSGYNHNLQTEKLNETAILDKIFDRFEKLMWFSAGYTAGNPKTVSDILGSLFQMVLYGLVVVFMYFFRTVFCCCNPYRKKKEEKEKEVQVERIIDKTPPKRRYLLPPPTSTDVILPSKPRYAEYRFGPLPMSSFSGDSSIEIVNDEEEPVRTLRRSTRHKNI